MPNLANIFKSLAEIVESMTDNHKPPLHVGEVMACWTYLAFVSNIINYEQVGMNTVTDQELRKFVQNAMDVAESHKKELAKFMVNEGIPLPSLPEEIPKADLSTIPSGAKLTDEEIANTLVVNFVFAADTCAASASQCLRTDVGMMFLKFQTDKLSLGFEAKSLMQKKGWLKTPPLYYPPNKEE